MASYLSQIMFTLFPTRGFSRGCHICKVLFVGPLGTSGADLWWDAHSWAASWWEIGQTVLSLSKGALKRQKQQQKSPQSSSSDQRVSEQCLKANKADLKNNFNFYYSVLQCWTKQSTLQNAANFSTLHSNLILWNLMCDTIRDEDRCPHMS